MKSILSKVHSSLLLLLFPLLLFGQSKRGNIWFLSNSSPEAPNLIGEVFDFNNDTLNISYYFNALNTLTDYTIICDEEGKALFYSNACALWTGDHEMVPGSDSINVSEVSVGNCPSWGQLGDMQLILPKPGHKDRYVLLHNRLDYNYIIPRFYYSEVEHRKGSIDTMISINQVLDTTTYFSWYLTATKHGNGRDWWIVIRSLYGNTYYWYLLSPDGVSLDHTQEIGTHWVKPNAGGQMIFSPDGNHFGITSPFFGADVFEVDRCAGRFTSFTHVDISPDSTKYTVTGINFSPSSRFLYLTPTMSIYQFDLEHADWPSTKNLVASYDGYVCFFPALFYQLITAPDKKMYYTGSLGNPCLGVIHEPDIAGPECNVEQHAYDLLNSFAFFVPNIPYFDAKPVAACKLPIDYEETDRVYAFSNITSDQAVIHVPNWVDGAGGFIYLTNVLGQELLRVPITAQETTLFLSGLPDATYFCYVNVGNKLYQGCHIVVIK